MCFNFLKFFDVFLIIFKWKDGGLDVTKKPRNEYDCGLQDRVVGIIDPGLLQRSYVLEKGKQTSCRTSHLLRNIRNLSYLKKKTLLLKTLKTI